jgi:ATP-dependent helicase/DNAse subunit B
VALTLILGPANSAKARETLSAYAAAAPRGALLVVPTRADARHYARELAEQRAVLGRVLTFSGLAGEIARRTGYAARPISNLARERVLRDVLDGVRFEVLRDSAGAPGFLRAAAELMAELERSLITPQRFAQALKRWEAQDERRAQYAAEVASIYRGYARRLEELARVDRELHVWRALDALRGAPGRWGEDQVFFYGFDDLHPLERDAVETLSQAVGAQVTLSLTYEAGRSALQARAEVVEELRQLAARVIELPPLDEYYEPGARRVLHHLERWLFAPAPERVDPGDAVVLLEAGGQRAEAELVGAEVLSLLRSGVPGHEIAVVCRSLAGSGPVIEGVFDQYGIPVAIERTVAFGATALGRALIALARCALLPDTATAADVLCVLRTPGVLERLEKADAVEAAVRRDSLATAAEALERLGFGLEGIAALRGAGDPVAELERQGRVLLAAPFAGQARLLDHAEELDARALSSMLAALGELRELGLLPSAAELIGLLEELEVDASRPLRPGAVQVSEPLAIRARRFQAVFVCGLQEGEFPAPAPPEPFFSDERRHELAMASGLRLAPAEDALHRERYLLYSAVSRATTRVGLSYRSSDEEGNLALPSPFIDDVAELLDPGWRERRRTRLLSEVVWAPDQAPTERELRHALVAARPAAVTAAAGQTRVLSERALAHVRHNRIVSGGALETYATCPVKWLVERELDPPRFEPEADPLAKGSYMHKVLEEVIGRLERAVTPESLAEAERILAQVVAEMPPTIAPGRPASVRAGVQAGIQADLLRYLRHEAADSVDWRPRGLEQRFGFEDEEGSLPALVLGDGADQILVRGMIDRVDVDPASGRRAIVRDYKSGARRDEWQGARWRTDSQLQVALYMLAVRQLMGLEPVAGLYQPLGGNDLRGRGIYLKGAGVGDRLVATDAREPAELDDELRDAAARAVELTHRLRTGALEPCPQTCSRQGCAHPGICRSEL